MAYMRAICQHLVDQSGAVHPTCAGVCYAGRMDDRAYWTRALQEAERALDAARGRTAVNAAAKRLMRVKAELRELEAGSQAGALGSPARLISDSPDNDGASAIASRGGLHSSSLFRCPAVAPLAGLDS
jgi:hypothetical protein